MAVMWLDPTAVTLLPLLRSMFALALVAILIGVSVWAGYRFSGAPRRSAAAWVGFIAMCLTVVAVSLWIIFVLPVYWD